MFEKFIKWLAQTDRYKSKTAWIWHKDEPKQCLLSNINWDDRDRYPSIKNPNLWYCTFFGHWGVFGREFFETEKELLLFKKAEFERTKIGKEQQLADFKQKYFEKLQNDPPTIPELYKKLIDYQLELNDLKATEHNAKFMLISNILAFVKENDKYIYEKHCGGDGGWDINDFQISFDNCPKSPIEPPANFCLISKPISSLIPIGMCIFCNQSATRSFEYK